MPTAFEQGQLRSLADRIKEARDSGALFHPTNPSDSYYCTECGVFGKGGEACWSCDSILIQWQYVPRWGGGAQTVVWDPEPSPGPNSMYFLMPDNPVEAPEFRQEMHQDYEDYLNGVTGLTQ